MQSLRKHVDNISTVRQLALCKKHAELFEPGATTHYANNLFSERQIRLDKSYLFLAAGSSIIFIGTFKILVFCTLIENRIYEGISLIKKLHTLSVAFLY